MTTSFFNSEIADNCDELLKLNSLVGNLSEGSDLIIEKTTRCFYKNWQKYFMESAKIIYSSYSALYVEEIAAFSFNDTILILINKAKKNELYIENATSKTIAFSIFKLKLHENIRKNKSKLSISNSELSTSSTSEIAEENQNNHEMLNCLEKVKSQLPEIDKNICEWKYKNKLSNSDIAQKLSISTEGFTNRFYRLTIRMEKLIKKCLNFSV